MPIITKPAKKDKNLTSTQYRVYFELQRIFQLHTVSTTIEVSNKTIADNLGVSICSISRAIKALQNAGYINVVYLGKGKERRKIRLL